ncbi:GerAB/ArcD/ProY family transporter [Sporosarcina sp. ITBMC105]
MRTHLHIHPSETFNAFMLFFIIQSAQIGVGIQGFQRVIYQDAKHDAWISVVLAGIATHIIAIFMLKTLQLYDSNDLYGIHQDVYGKWIGNFINILYILFITMSFFAVLRNYTEVVQSWVFPSLSTWFLVASILLIVIYAVTGGLRVIVGISFFSFVFSILFLPLLGFPLKYIEPRNLLPVLEANIGDLLKGVQSMTFTVIGFEILYVIYPFIKEKEHVKKPLHLSLLVTTIIYVGVMLVTLTYFSGEQLAKVIWATLTLFSIVKFPFVERMEYIAICFWMLIILPNLCLFLWAAYRGTIRIVNISIKRFAWLYAFLIFTASFLLTTRNQINWFNEYLGRIAIYIIFVYPIVLYIIASIKNKGVTRKAQKK